MTGMETIGERVDRLEREVAQLRRQRWWAGRSIVALLTLAAANQAITQTPAIAPLPAVTCRQLRVMSANKPMLVLDSDNDGGLFTINGSDGKARVRIAVDKDGGGMETLGNDGKPRTTIGVDGDGGWSAIFGPDGRQRVMLGIESGDGGVAVFDRAGRLKASLP